MKRPVLRSRRRGSGNDLRQNATCPDGAPVHPAPGIALGKWVMQGRPARRCAGGYTLIEILVATTLALMLMGAVVAMFARVGESINDARSMLEAADRLRLAAARLQADLGGLTVTVNPPRDPANNEGYLEYIEGPVVTTPYSKSTPPQSTNANPYLPLPSQVAFNTDNGKSADTSVGDFDDILMFTTRSSGRPFVGLGARRCSSVRSGRGGLVLARPQPPSPRAAGHAQLEPEHVVHDALRPAASTPITTFRRA